MVKLLSFFTCIVFTLFLTFHNNFAGSIFFVDGNSQSESAKYPIWKEYVDLQDRLNKAIKISNSMNNQENSQRVSILVQEIDNLQKKFMLAAVNKAKQKSATALLEINSCGQNIFVDSAYDVTHEVIEELNQNYISSPVRQVLLTPQDILHQAIKENNTDGVTAAINAGANINFEKLGQSPISWAIRFRSAEVVKVLLDSNAKADASLIQLAIDNFSIKSAVLIAIKCGVDLNGVYSQPYHSPATLLEIAAKSSEFDALLLLIKTGKVNFSGNMIVREAYTLMEVVVHWGNMAEELIQHIINHGYNVNDIWSTTMTLRNGSIFQNVNILKLFIKNGANVNHVFTDPQNKSISWNPLAIAIHTFNSYRNDSIIKVLLTAGADINQKINPIFNGQICSNGTPLSFAMEHKNPELLEILLLHK